VSRKKLCSSTAVATAAAFAFIVLRRVMGRTPKGGHLNHLRWRLHANKSSFFIKALVATEPGS